MCSHNSEFKCDLAKQCFDRQERMAMMHDFLLVRPMRWNCRAWPSPAAERFEVLSLARRRRAVNGPRSFRAISVRQRSAVAASWRAGKIWSRSFSLWT